MIQEQSPSILQNAVKVGDTILNSVDVHDYCAHDGIMIDGGREYMRRGGDFNRTDVTDLCITTDMPTSVYADRVLWGTRGKDGKDEFKWVLLKDCTNEHLANILENQKKIANHVKHAIYYILHKRAIAAIGNSSYFSFYRDQSLAIRFARQRPDMK